MLASRLDSLHAPVCKDVRAHPARARARPFTSRKRMENLAPAPPHAGSGWRKTWTAPWS